MKTLVLEELRVKLKQIQRHSKVSFIYCDKLLAILETDILDFLTDCLYNCWFIFTATTRQKDRSCADVKSKLLVSLKQLQ